MEYVQLEYIYKKMADWLIPSPLISNVWKFWIKCNFLKKSFEQIAELTIYDGNFLPPVP